MNAIRGFFGEHRWLSNFWFANIFENGVRFPTSEHYYQYHKMANKEGKEAVLGNPTPGSAKKTARWYPIVEDWEQVKISVMRRAVYLKFKQNPTLLRKLLHTGDVELVEANTWGDTFWGVEKDTGFGQNNLGKILMETRELLTNEDTGK